jgi:hypothetical protein
MQEIEKKIRAKLERETQDRMDREHKAGEARAELQQRQLEQAQAREELKAIFDGVFDSFVASLKALFDGHREVLHSEVLPEKLPYPQGLSMTRGYVKIGLVQVHPVSMYVAMDFQSQLVTAEPKHRNVKLTPAGIATSADELKNRFLSVWDARTQGLPE